MFSFVSFVDCKCIAIIEARSIIDDSMNVGQHLVRFALLISCDIRVMGVGCEVEFVVLAKEITQIRWLQIWSNIQFCAILHI